MRCQLTSHGYGDVHGEHGFGKRNTEGERILDFALASDLVVGNTLFPKKESHLVTFSSGGKKTQVDYVLYGRGVYGSVSNVKVIPGEEVVQLHFLLVSDSTVRISPQKKQKKRKFVSRLRPWKLRDPAGACRFCDVFLEQGGHSSTT